MTVSKGSTTDSQPPDGPGSASRARAHLERLATILDASIKIPGTTFSFGLDALIGVIPAFGDVAGFLLGSYILYHAALSGVPKRVLAVMAFNLLVDTLVGVVPIAGDIFDVAWQANRKNVRLARRALEEGGAVHTRSPSQVKALAKIAFACVFLALTAVAGGAVYLLVRLLEEIF